MEPEIQPSQGGVALESFARVASYPVVSSVFQYANFFYSNAKKSESTLVQRALSTAETVVAPLARIPELYPSTVKQVDNLALRQLDTVESLVSHGTQYVSSSRYYATGLIQLGVDYRQKFSERMNQVIEPITSVSQQTLSSVRNVSPFSSEQVFQSGPKVDEKKEGTKEEKPSLFRPLIRIVTPILDTISEKRSVFVHRVSSGVEERRKFASQMFKSAETTYQTTMQSAHEKVKITRQFAENVYHEPHSYYESAKQTSSQLVYSGISLGISVPRYFLHKIRTAVEVLEKHRSAESEMSNSQRRLNLLLSPIVFQYANATLDFSDSLLWRASTFFTPLEKVEKVIVTSQPQKVDPPIESDEIEE